MSSAGNNAQLNLASDKDEVNSLLSDWTMHWAWATKHEATSLIRKNFSLDGGLWNEFVFMQDLTSSPRVITCVGNSLLFVIASQTLTW